MKKKLILSSLFVLALSVVACQKNAVVETSAAEERAGISITNPLKGIVFFSDKAGTTVLGLQKIDFTGNTSDELGFPPTSNKTLQVRCESPAGSGNYAAPVAMTLTNGVGFLPCAETKDYSFVLANNPVINFKIGMKTFSTTIDLSTSEFDQTSFHVAANDAFAGTAPIIDASTNPEQVKVTLTEGGLYSSTQLLASYDNFHYSVAYMKSGADYAIEGSLTGPFTITDGGTVDAILGEDVAGIVAGADAGSVIVVGYFLGTAAAGKAHKLLTTPITLN